MTKLFRVLILCLAVGIGATAASATTFVVNSTDDIQDATPGDGVCATVGSVCTLRAAITEANALAGNDTITLPAGTYTISLVSANDDNNAGGDFDLKTNIVINGAGSGTTIIQAAASPGTATERVLDILAGSIVTVSGVTIQNGRFAGVIGASNRGGGIENVGNLTLTNCIVKNNTVASTSGNPIGGGIYNGAATLTLNGTTVTGNTSSSSATSAFGGGIASIGTSTLTINNSSISSNAATSTFTGGLAFAAGLYLQDGFNVTATDSHFDNNVGTSSTGSNGGGVRALSNSAAAVFNATNTTFNGNSGVGGGASHQGIGVQLFTTTAVAATLSVTFDGVSINNNSGTSVGIGMDVTGNGGPITINAKRTTIASNIGGLNAGGVLLSNANSTLVSPITFNLTNSTISGNTASNLAGGFAQEQPTSGVVNSTFNFVTVANNSATATGGGLYIVNGGFNLKNSVVAHNTAPSSPDVAGTVNSQNYNHFESLSGATISGTTTNNTVGDAMLGALADNGGNMLTHLPGTGSPLIDAIPNGTNDCGTVITADQRGIARPSGSGCDKGSVEVQVATGPVMISGKVMTPGGNGIRNVMVTISGGGLSSPITVQTGSFGIYAFTDLAPNQTYTVTANGQRYTFIAPSVNVTPAADTVVNFTSNEAIVSRQDDTKDPVSSGKQ